MKILITGGNGFIARNLSEHLNDNGYVLTLLNRQGLDLLEQQKVFDLIKSKRFDVVIHTATYDAAPRHSTKDPSKVLENNLRMFFNLARCKDHFGKMIYFGSGAEFDREHWKPRMREDYFDQHIPQDQYGFSKYVMTKHAQLSANIYNLRLFGVFGKYDDWQTRFIPNACCQAVLGLPVTIKQNKLCDFLYIDDLVKIVRWFIGNSPRRNVYNICTGKVNDFKSLAEKIIKISGKQLDIVIETAGFGREYSGDNALLLEELRDFKFQPFDKSIKELYGWYEENKQIIEKDKL